MELHPNDLQALADKIDGLDLTDAEKAVLDAVFERAAASDEVSGYLEIEQTSTYGGSKLHDTFPTNVTARKIAGGLGFVNWPGDYPVSG